jgi:TonB family protein
MPTRTGFFSQAFLRHRENLKTESRLARNSLNVEKVPLARYATHPPTDPGPTCAYGIRVFYQAGALRFPDFTLQLFERQESNPTNLEQQSVSYRFFVYDAAGVQLPGSVAFTTYDLANGRSFRVGKKTYVAEMFFSTANPNVGSGVERYLPLREGELIVWDESTARSGNTRLLAAWNSAEADRSGLTFAAGTPVALGIFQNTLMTMGDEWRRPSALDAPLTVTHSARIVYPDELSGSGLIARLSGAIFVNADGTVDHAHVISSNTDRFNQAANSALKQWRFSVPKKNGQAVKALVSFTWAISEPVSESIQLSLK